MADNSTSTVYCTVDDVQRWVKRVQFSETSKVTKADVDTYIQSMSAVLDGELRALGFTLPIASSAKITMGILKLMVSYEVASQAEQAANFGTNKNESSHGEWLHKQYDNLLQKIKDNPAMLSDVVRAGVNYMKTSTEDVGPCQEAFPEQRVADFIQKNKTGSDPTAPSIRREI